MDELFSELSLRKIEFYEKQKLIEEGISECENLIEKEPDNL
jgi:hypothetical protein